MWFCSNFYNEVGERNATELAGPFVQLANSVGMVGFPPMSVCGLGVDHSVTCFVAWHFVYN